MNPKMSQKIDEKFVIKKCEQLLSELCIDSVPVNLNLIGSYFGVESIQDATIEEAGKVIPQNNGSYVVLVRRSDPPGRKRFTVAHELGHLIVPGAMGGHGVVDYEVGEFDKHKNIEFLCDTAAASLLMPNKLFDDFVKGKRFNFITVMEVSTRFNVSLEAAALQMVKRDQSKRAVIVWELSHKPQEEFLLATSTLPGFEAYIPKKQLRVRYAYGLSGRELIPKSKSLDETEGVVAEAFADVEKNIYKSKQSMIFSNTLSLDCHCEAMSTIDGRVLSLITKSIKLKK